jgi:VIT1/CCC1 family predicted Fe2+/Mn2+ transporter
MPASTERRWGLRIAAWLSLLVGLYSVVAVASILGLFTGAFAGALGAIVSVAVVTDRPDARTRRVAKAALAINGIALAAFVAVLVPVGISEL